MYTFIAILVAAITLVCGARNIRNNYRKASKIRGNSYSAQEDAKLGLTLLIGGSILVGSIWPLSVPAGIIGYVAYLSYKAAVKWVTAE